MRKIYLIVIYFFYLLFQAFRVLKLKWISKFKGSEAAEQYKNKALVKWAVGTNKIFGVKVTAIGQENIPDGAVVFISNHQSNFDTPVLIEAGAIAGFISKKEVFKVPMLGYWMKQIHCVSVDRDNIRDAVKMIQNGVKNLKQGYSMLIFPAGTRAKDGVIKEFKNGSFKLATKAKVPIVPVTVDGTNMAYEYDGKLRKANVTVTFHKPISTENLSREEEKQLAETVHDIVATSLNK